jgi:hypothetical protein
MKDVHVNDDTEKGTTTVSFTFDSRNARDLSEIGALFQTARAMTSEQAWLGTELEAHLAYFSVLERGARGVIPIGFRSESATQEPSAAAGDASRGETT